MNRSYINNWLKIFPKSYCWSLWVKGLQSHKLSKLEVWKKFFYLAGVKSNLGCLISSSGQFDYPEDLDYAFTWIFHRKLILIRHFVVCKKRWILVVLRDCVKCTCSLQFESHSAQHNRWICGFAGQMLASGLYTFEYTVVWLSKMGVSINFM